MFQILLVLIFILVLGLGGFLFFTQSPEKKLSETNFNVENSSEKAVLGQEKIQEQSKELISTSKDSLQGNVNQTAQTINDFIEDKVSQVLGQKNDPPKIEIIEPGVVVEGVNQELTFDLSKDRSRKMNLKVGSKYLLDFQNVPEGFCLYINNQQYQLSENKKILFQFSSTGSYPLKMDFCDNTQKDLGEFVVN